MSGEYSPASSGPAWHDVLHTLASPIAPPPRSPIPISEIASSPKAVAVQQGRRWSATTSTATKASGGSPMMSQSTADPRVYRPKTMRSPVSSSVAKSTPMVPRLMTSRSPPAVKSQSARQQAFQHHMTEAGDEHTMARYLERKARDEAKETRRAASWAGGKKKSGLRIDEYIMSQYLKRGARDDTKASKKQKR